MQVFFTIMSTYINKLLLYFTDPRLYYIIFILSKDMEKRTCRKCKEDKPTNLFYNYLYNKTLQRTCKECIEKYRARDPNLIERKHAVKYQSEESKKYFKAKRSNDNPSTQ